MNSEPMYPVTAFLYLGRKVVYNNSDWEALYQNIWKAWRRWLMVGKVVSKTGAMVREWVNFKRQFFGRYYYTGVRVGW